MAAAWQVENEGLTLARDRRPGLEVLRSGFGSPAPAVVAVADPDPDRLPAPPPAVPVG